MDHKVLLERLSHEIENFRSSDRWLDWLRFAARFRTYSARNQILIQMQMPTAHQVAGYKAWLAMGRNVRKGEKGIAILAPVIVKKEQEGGELKKVIIGFRTVFVFDISQTEGADVPGFTLPTVGLADLGLLDELKRKAEQDGITVITSAGPSVARGWWTPADRSITLVQASPVGPYSIPSQTRTMLHELAHSRDIPVAENLAQRVRREDEVVAESAAYIIGTGKYGIDMNDASSAYTLSWGGTAEGLLALTERVVRVAQQLEGMLS